MFSDITPHFTFFTLHCITFYVTLRVNIVLAGRELIYARVCAGYTNPTLMTNTDYVCRLLNSYAARTISILLVLNLIREPPRTDG